MARRTFIFSTEAQADAFKLGVETVNDSAFTVEAITHSAAGFEVDCQDDDYAADENGDAVEELPGEREFDALALGDDGHHVTPGRY